MLDIVSKILSNPTTEDYQQLMLTFLQGIVSTVREKEDPLKANWKYHCVEEIILEHGQFQEGGQAQQIGIPQQCYENGINMLFSPENPEDLIYCQGYALSYESDLRPVQHAWVYIDEQVIDVTWNYLSPCYFGIPFNRQWVMETTEEKLRNGDHIASLLAYESPLTLEFLKYGFPSEALHNYS